MLLYRPSTFLAICTLVMLSLLLSDDPHHCHDVQIYQNLNSKKTGSSSLKATDTKSEEPWLVSKGHTRNQKLRMRFQTGIQDRKPQVLIHRIRTMTPQSDRQIFVDGLKTEIAGYDLRTKRSSKKVKPVPLYKKLTRIKFSDLRTLRYVSSGRNRPPTEFTKSSVRKKSTHLQRLSLKNFLSATYGLRKMDKFQFKETTERNSARSYSGKTGGAMNGSLIEHIKEVKISPNTFSRYEVRWNNLYKHSDNRQIRNTDYRTDSLRTLLYPKATFSKNAFKSKASQKSVVSQAVNGINREFYRYAQSKKVHSLENVTRENRNFFREMPSDDEVGQHAFTTGKVTAASGEKLGLGNRNGLPTLKNAQPSEIKAPGNSDGISTATDEGTQLLGGMNGKTLQNNTTAFQNVDYPHWIMHGNSSPLFYLLGNKSKKSKCRQVPKKNIPVKYAQDNTQWIWQHDKHSVQTPVVSQESLVEISFDDDALLVSGSPLDSTKPAEKKSPALVSEGLYEQHHMPKNWMRTALTRTKSSIRYPVTRYEKPLPSTGKFSDGIIPPGGTSQVEIQHPEEVLSSIHPVRRAKLPSKRSLVEEPSNGAALQKNATDLKGVPVGETILHRQGQSPDQKKLDSTEAIRDSFSEVPVEQKRHKRTVSLKEKTSSTGISNMDESPANLVPLLQPNFANKREEKDKKGAVNENFLPDESIGIGLFRGRGQSKNEISLPDSEKSVKISHGIYDHVGEPSKQNEIKNDSFVKFYNSSELSSDDEYPNHKSVLSDGWQVNQPSNRKIFYNFTDMEYTNKSFNGHIGIVPFDRESSDSGQFPKELDVQDEPPDSMKNHTVKSTKDLNNSNNVPSEVFDVVQKNLTGLPSLFAVNISYGADGYLKNDGKFDLRSTMSNENNTAESSPADLPKGTDSVGNHDLRHSRDDVEDKNFSVDADASLGTNATYVWNELFQKSNKTNTTEVYNINNVSSRKNGSLSSEENGDDDLLIQNAAHDSQNGPKNGSNFGNFSGFEGVASNEVSSQELDTEKQSNETVLSPENETRTSSNRANTNETAHETTADTTDSTTADTTDSTTADTTNSTTADTRDSTTADTTDSTTADTTDSTTADTTNSTTADTTDSTTADTTDSTIADTTDSTTADTTDSTTADTTDSTTADTTDSTTADTTDSITADTTDSTTADATDSTTANTTDSTTADTTDSTTLMPESNFSGQNSSVEWYGTKLKEYDYDKDHSTAGTGTNLPLLFETSTKSLPYSTQKPKMSTIQSEGDDLPSDTTAISGVQVNTNATVVPINPTTNFSERQHTLPTINTTDTRSEQTATTTSTNSVDAFAIQKSTTEEYLPQTTPYFYVTYDTKSDQDLDHVTIKAGEDQFTVTVSKGRDLDINETLITDFLTTIRPINESTTYEESDERSNDDSSLSEKTTFGDHGPWSSQTRFVDEKSVFMETSSQGVIRVSTAALDEDSTGEDYSSTVKINADKGVTNSNQNDSHGIDRDRWSDFDFETSMEQENGTLNNSDVEYRMKRDGNSKEEDINIPPSQLGSNLVPQVKVSNGHDMNIITTGVVEESLVPPVGQKGIGSSEIDGMDRIDTVFTDDGKNINGITTIAVTMSGIDPVNGVNIEADVRLSIAGTSSTDLKPSTVHNIGTSSEEDAPEISVDETFGEPQIPPPELDINSPDVPFTISPDIPNVGNGSVSQFPDAPVERETTAIPTIDDMNVSPFSSTIGGEIHDGTQATTESSTISLTVSAVTSSMSSEAITSPPTVTAVSTSSSEDSSTVRTHSPTSSLASTSSQQSITTAESTTTLNDNKRFTSAMDSVSQPISAMSTSTDIKTSNNAPTAGTVNSIAESSFVTTASDEISATSLGTASDAKISGTTLGTTTTVPVVPFHFTIDADYDEVVGNRKEEFQESLTTQLARVMRLPYSCIEDLQVARGSIEVSFNLVPDPSYGHMADEEALKLAADELKRMIDTGQLDLSDLDGNTLVVVPIDPPTTPTPILQKEHTTLILGVVIGMFVITVITVAIVAVVIKNKSLGGRRLSPIEEARSKMPSYREIPFQEALYVKGNGRGLHQGKYCYDSGRWLGPGPEPQTAAPNAASYRPPTDLELRNTPRPPSLVRARLKNNWDLDWDAIMPDR